MTGSLQIKNNKYYIVLNDYVNGKRKQKWVKTELPIKGNKRKAERAEAIFKADEACALRIPQQNPDLGYVYDNLLQGRAHELLHIHYPAHGQHS